MKNLYQAMLSCALLVFSICVFGADWGLLSRQIEESNPQHQEELRSRRALEIQRNQFEMERLQQQEQQRQQELQQQQDLQQQQQRQQEIQDRQNRRNEQALKLQPEKNEVQLCLKGIETDPKFKGIKGKISLTQPAAASITMLANQKKPTSKEIELIAIWGDKLDKCWPIEKNFYKSQSEFHYAISDAARSVQQSLIVNLYKKEITYGEFSRREKKIAEYMESSFSEIESILLSGNDAYSRASQVKLDTVKNIARIMN